MKAQMETNAHDCSSSSLTSLRSTQDGRIHKVKPSGSQKEEENEEIKAYLAKLQELVPSMPKNRKLSKLEVVTYVIDYIRYLRTTLGLPPQNRPHPSESGESTCSSEIVDPLEIISQANFSLSVMSSNSSNSTPRNFSQSYSSPNHSRQPLVVISTTNNTTVNGSCVPREIQQLMDMSTLDLEPRSVSC